MTSLDGLLSTVETPNLKEIYRDPSLGVVAVHILGEKHVIHSEIFGDITREKIQKAQLVNTMIDEAFQRKGVDRLYTWAQTDVQYRWNLFLGYKPTGLEVVGDGIDRPTYEFEKVLN